MKVALNTINTHTPSSLYVILFFFLGGAFIFMRCLFSLYARWPSWPWSYGSWIYNHLCNKCLSPLMLWVLILIRARSTTLCDKVCQWIATGRWFSPGPPVSSTNKTDRHDITEILLKVTLNTIKQTHILICPWFFPHLSRYF